MEVGMNPLLNLKEIEKRAIQSTYQDGLLDIQYGLIVACMAIFIYRPESGYSPLNIILAIVGIVLTNLLFMVGKRIITLPRMGMVKFGEIRHKKNRRMAIVLGVFILAQVVLVIFTSLGLFNSQIGSWIDKVLGNHSGSLLVVSAIGSLMVGVSIIVMSYFTDFDRGFYISILMALAVFLMIFLNRPLWPILIGLVIIIPGVVLLVRFLKRYPIIKEGVEHD